MLSNTSQPLAFAGLEALRQALATGELTSQALVADALRQIEIQDTKINAVISVDATGAMNAAMQADEARRDGTALGPLHGIPFAVKDNTDVAGFVTTGGLGIRAGALPAATDAPAVACLRQAGAIPIAKLNLHEAALGASNHNVHHGHCFNPLALDCSPGGSSGGSAAAVAAGYVPFALGTDTMGSLRIPAAYCGTIGLKASYGRISTGGTLIVSRRLDHVGPITGNLSDMRLLLDVMGRWDSLDPRSRSYIASCASNEGNTDLHISTGGARDHNLYRFSYPKSLDGFGVEAQIESAFYELIAQLARAGHRLTPVDLSGLDLGGFRRAGLMVCEADMLTVSADWFADASVVSDELQGLLNWVTTKSALDLATADQAIDNGAREMLALLENADAYLSPTAPQRPFLMSDPVPPGQADLTNFANMAGNPALSVPLLIEGELPAGLQVVAPLGDDYKLLELTQDIVACSEGRVIDKAYRAPAR